MTVADWVSSARTRLMGAGVESAAMEAQLLAAHVLLVDRSYVLSHPSQDFAGLAGEALLQRRLAGEPLAYILGKREFYGRDFVVRPGVLIPRQETETLLDAALAVVEPGSSVLDLGTGSGCVGITLALECAGCEVTASDISVAALDVARENAERLSAKLRLVQSDGFRELVGESFDLIVTNPPYVSLSEALEAQVRDFEPPEALFAGESGLEFYERLAVEAADYLRDQGLLMMEVGHTQAREVVAIFEAQGWNLVEVRKDLSGIERVVVVQPVFACAS